MKVIIDWVPNHTGADHRWLTQHPDFFVKDKDGKPAVAFDWADARQLNYQQPRDAGHMIAAMRYWVTQDRHRRLSLRRGLERAGNLLAHVHPGAEARERRIYARRGRQRLPAPRRLRRGVSVAYVQGDGKSGRGRAPAH